MRRMNMIRTPAPQKAAAKAPMRGLLLALLIAIAPAAAARAEPPQVIAARADNLGGAWTISVTLRHPDTGWEHYADGWEVLSPDGKRLGMRVLAHPHVNEQPFTRSLSGVLIPAGMPYVLIRARCNTTGWSESTYKLKLR